MKSKSILRKYVVTIEDHGSISKREIWETSPHLAATSAVRDIIRERLAHAHLFFEIKNVREVRAAGPRESRRQ